MISEIFNMSQAIKDGRTVQTAFNHLIQEVAELSAEINIELGVSDQKPGEDGIVGEAIDICLCALDIVWQKTDGKMTREEVIAFINKKLLKWQSTTDKKTKQNASKTNSGNT